MCSVFVGERSHVSTPGRCLMFRHAAEHLERRLVETNV